MSDVENESPTSTPRHHIVTIVVENKPGVLTRVAGLFSRRAFNIFSLAVSPTDDDRFSRMTIVVDVESTPLEQITKQLNKLINVIKIEELALDNAVQRELMLVTLKADGDSRSKIIDLSENFESRVLDDGTDSLTLMVTGEPSELDAVTALLAPFGIAELQRTGRIALPRLDLDEHAGNAQLARAGG